MLSVIMDFTVVHKVTRLRSDTQTHTNEVDSSMGMRCVHFLFLWVQGFREELKK